MMKKRLALVLAMLLLALCMPALAEGNMVINGDFEQSADGNNPSGWFRDMWFTSSGMSDMGIEGGGQDGGQCIKVENIEPNDARFAQDIPVEPNACYRITGYIRAEGVDEMASGASLSIKDTFVSTDYLYDTGGEWQAVSLVGITSDEQTELTLMCRLGDYGSLTTGAAWFDGIEMEKLENAVLDEGIASFQTVAPSEERYEGPDLGERFQSLFGAAEVVLLLLLGLAFAAACALLTWFVERGRIDLATGSDGRRTLGWILALALLARIIIALTVRGYDTDINCFEAWSARMAELGPVGFYENGYFCDYPPGYMYVLWAVGGLRNLLRIPFDSNLDWLFIKLPPILLDIGLAWLLYGAAKKRVGRAASLLLAGLCALNPAAILNSAAWGQIDAALAIMLSLSILWAMEDKWSLSLPMFALSILVKPQALMFAPLGLVALIMRIARDDNWPHMLVRMLGYIAVSLLAMLAVSLPFIWSIDPALLAKAGVLWLPAPLQPIGWLASLYGKTLNSYPHITLNACNLYTLLDLNWKEISDVPRLAAFATAAMTAGYLYAAALYIRARDVKKLPLLAALVLTVAFCFGPMMHERYLFPALALLLLAYMEDRDVRLIGAFVLITFSQFMNAALVLRSEHLQASEQIVNAGVSLANLLACALLCWTSFDLCFRDHTVAITRRYMQTGTRAQALTEARQDQFAEAIFRQRDYKLALRWRDWALMAAITILYAAVAFANLGDTAAPQVTWTSSQSGEQVVFDLGQVREFHLAYYGSSFNDVSFQVELSDDDQTWTQPYFASFDQGQVFRWVWYEPMVADTEGEGGYTPLHKSLDGKHPLHQGRYVRLTMLGSGLILNEVAFVDADGAVLPIEALQASGGRQNMSQNTAALIDEQQTVPAHPSHLNGTYFDEIYHARTAYENIHGLHTYEYTHPPLGKLLIALGIKLFGMTPFGWRFMGTLFGVLMVPLMYLLAKQLLKRTSYAAIAALLLAFDCMHFTQTRIATIDSFAVFFIMLMYLFMFRYCLMNYYHVRLWRTLVPLGLCGIVMGCAIASKWIGIYAAIGLAVLLFYTLWARFREYRYVQRHMDTIDVPRRPKAQRILKAHWRSLAITISFCLVFFVCVPLLIYYYSYYWQLTPDGNFNVRGVWQVQQSMLDYHAGLGGDPHLFRSPWYQWPFVAWPMWYYTGNEFLPDGWISSISCMGNPAVFWVGLAAMLFVLGRMFTRSRYDRRYVFIAVGFLSQYLPWVLVPRSTFIYHYFASVPFIILATALALDYIRRRNQRAYRIAAIAVCTCALALFAFFYPIASGTEIPLWYARLTRWFNWINY